MLLGLRHPALVRGDDEQRDVDRAHAGEHVLDEAHVAGHVDEADLRARRQRREREAEVDGEPARLLLGEPVGVGAGEREDERRLAVVDVAGGRDDCAPVRRARAQRAASARRRRRGRRVRRSHTTAPSSTRATTPCSRSVRERGVGVGGSTATPTDGIVEARERAAAGHGFGVDDLRRRRTVPTIASARARSVVDGRASPSARAGSRSRRRRGTRARRTAARRASSLSARIARASGCAREASRRDRRARR